MLRAWISHRTNDPMAWVHSENQAKQFFGLFPTIFWAKECPHSETILDKKCCLYNRSTPVSSVELSVSMCGNFYKLVRLPWAFYGVPGVTDRNRCTAQTHR